MKDCCDCSGQEQVEDTTESRLVNIQSKQQSAGNQEREKKKAAFVAFWNRARIKGESSLKKLRENTCNEMKGNVQENKKMNETQT